MDRKRTPDHAAGKGLRYLRERGLKEFSAHAVEKVRDKSFDYQKWIRSQQISSVQAGYQKKLILARMPKVYVLISGSGSPDPEGKQEVLRRETIRSVQASTYPGVHLIQTLNSQIGDEDYLTFVRAGDLIERNAIFEMVQALQDGADAVYSDEDSYERTEEGIRYRDPLFKPDYNPDYLRSCNYIGFLFMARVGMIRSFYQDGHSDLVPSEERLADPAYRYALILRCTRSASAAGGVRHVAKVLCHVRAEREEEIIESAAPGSEDHPEDRRMEEDAQTLPDGSADRSASLRRKAKERTRSSRSGWNARGKGKHGKWMLRTMQPSREVQPASAQETKPVPSQEMQPAFSPEARPAFSQEMKSAPSRGTLPASCRKNPAAERMRAALEADLKERGYRGTVEDGPLPGTFHIAYEIEDEPLVSIVIPNRDNASVLENCILSVRTRTTWKNYEIVVVENNSRLRQTYELYRKLEERKEARIVRYPEAFHFSRVINEGVRRAKGDYLILMNNDVTVRSADWIERLLAHVKRPEVGAAGPKLLYPDGRVQSAGIVTGIMGFAGSMMVAEDGNDPGYMGRGVLTQDLSAVTAACMMVKRSAFLKAGGFPEEFSVALGDVDFCLSLGEAGYRIVFEPAAVMIHHESLTRGAEDSKEKKKRFAAEQARFRKKRARILKEGDPAYNPNLSRRRCDWSQQT